MKHHIRQRLLFPLIISLVIAFPCLVDAQHFNITAFGAKADNSTINTTYIQQAIDACAISGGGTVYIPSGTFLTGTLELRSNTHLYLEAGAELKGSPNIWVNKPHKSPTFDTPTRY